MLDCKITTDSAMTWLEWSSVILSALAWPTAFVVVALAFRSQITKLFGRAKRISWGEAAFDFSEALDKIEESGQEIAAVSEPPSEPQKDPRFLDLLNISPAAAVLDAWMPLEKKLREIEPKLEMRRGLGPISLGRIILELGRRGLISPSDYETLHRLSRLRNSAAHAGEEEISVSDGLRFALQAALQERKLASLVI